MAVTDDANPYPEGTVEGAEWDAIRERVIAEYVDRRRAVAGFVETAGGEPDVDEHLQMTLAASGVVFGPDVSQYQGQPDWAKVKSSGCAFGFYKVSEGRTFLDPSCGWNKTHVPAAGLVPGCYHYLYFGAEYVADPSLWAGQARWFVQNADPHALHMLDVEAPATAGNHLGVREWVAEYRRLMPGHRLGLYANHSLWTNRSRVPYSPAGLFDYYWHAGVGDGFYTTATGTIPAQWAGTSRLTNSAAGDGYPTVRLWQITDHASVPGVGGSFCDGNAWQGTADELRALITGGVVDDMSQADVDAIKAFITSEVDRLLVNRLGAPWVKASAYGGDAAPGGLISPVGMTYQNYLQLKALVGELSATVADDPSLAQISGAVQATIASSMTGQAPVIASAVVTGLRDVIPGEVNVDYDRVHTLVVTALDEHLGSMRIVSDAPQAAVDAPPDEGT